MNFDHDSVCTGGNGGCSHRGHQFGLAGGVTGVYHDGKMRQLMQRRYGGNIQGVSGVGFKGPDAPFAEDDIFVAFAHDVFCAHQQLLQRVCQTALEEDRFLGFANFFQQIEVLHISGADLNDINLIKQI